MIADRVHPDPLLPDFKTTPFWWERSAPLRAGAVLPEGPVDAVVVGGGLSGLFTALALTRGGLSVVVLEAEHVGAHASGRNFGAIGRTIRLSFSELTRRYDLNTATRVYDEARDWVDFTADFIEREGIDCGFHRNGRVVAAHCRAAYEAMASELEVMQSHIDVATRMVPRERQHEELASNVYHGCAVYEDVGHLDPGRYLAGVVKKVEQAGAVIVDRTRVVAIDGSPGKFSVRTAAGERIETHEVVLTTNAECGTDNALFRFFRRRVVPIVVYSAVSAPIDPELMSHLFPRGRTILESRRLYLAMRPIEAESRILLVSRHMQPYRRVESAARDIRKDMLVRYPALRDVRFSHIWSGRFAVTFDWLPHLGTHNGIHYLIGLNGAGVPASGYLGHKLAQRILGKPNRDTVFADRKFPSKPGYSGTPWFLPPVGGWMRFWDRREASLPR